TLGIVKETLYVPELRSPHESRSRFKDGGLGGGGIVSALIEQTPVAALPSPRALAPPSILKKKPASYRAFAVTIVSNVPVRSNREFLVQVDGDTLMAREIRMSLAVQLSLFALLTGVAKTFCIQIWPVCDGPLSAPAGGTAARMIPPNTRPSPVFMMRAWNCDLDVMFFPSKLDSAAR